MNRLKQYLDAEEPLMPEGDYWIVECLYERTSRQRAYRRAFDRDRQQEEKADRRPWEEED